MFTIEKPKNRRLLLAVLLSVGALLLLTVIVLRLSLYGAHFSPFIENQMATILGMPVKIESSTIDFPTLTLKQLTLGKGSGSIDSLTVRIGLSPFSGAFLAPEVVRIGTIRLEVEKSAVTPILGRLMGASAGAVPDLAPKRSSLSLRFLPLLTEIGAIQLSLNQEPKAEVYSVDHLSCQRTGDSLLCQMKHLKSSAGWQEDDLTLGFSRSPKDQWLMKGSGRSASRETEDMSEQTPAWNGDFSLESDRGTTVARFQLRGLPSFIQRLIVDHLGAQPAATIRGQLRAKPLEGGPVAYSLALETDHLDFSSTAISRDPIGPFPALLRTKGRWFPLQGALTVEDGAIVVSSKRQAETNDSTDLEGPEMSPSSKWVGKGTLRAFFNARGEWATKEQPRPTSLWTFHLRIPSTACSDLVNFAPEMMWPPLKNLILSGSTELEADAEVKGNSPQDFQLALTSVKFDCKIVRVPPELSPATLQGPLNVRRSPKQGPERFVEIGPNSGTFTAYENIPSVVRTAILSAEDAGFFVHHGIDFPQMEVALRRNLVEGRIHVGASTITMQTVKNLFLSNERTLVRKLQELLLAWTIEKQIPKQRIFEIYLNLAEFGPGVYGVGEAAKHFFNKTPGELSLIEGVYLSSLLPSPTDRYLSFCKNAVSPGHHALVQIFLRRMYELGRISPTEFNQAFATPIRFTQLGTPTVIELKAQNCQARHLPPGN